MALMALNNIERGLEKASLSRQNLLNLALNITNQTKKETLGSFLAENVNRQKEIFQNILSHTQPNIKKKLEQEISASEQSRKAAISAYSPPVSSILKQFEQNLQSAAEKIKANCPAPNFSSWHFQIMCTTQLNKATPTNEEYHELGSPCPWEESGKIEVYRAQSEIIRYLGTTDGKSREINCEVACGSNNCPLSENEEAKRKNCPYPIYHLITFPWPEDEEFKNKLKANIDQSIAEECELRGIKFRTDGRRLTEIEEKDCQIIEGKCDYTVIKNLAGKDQLARACCCSCARPERENLSYGQGLVNLKPTPTSQPPVSQDFNFTCQLENEIVDGFQMNYLIVKVGDKNYKIPEFTCADNQNYKVAWCGKVKSIPAEINNQEAIINLFYEQPVACEPMEGQTASCVKTTSSLGLTYGKCSYSPNY